ncbi:MAG: glycosyltransferase [Bacteroidales bacterium]|nr:glycosyltransferase [Bacteroidales bacterium]
MNIQVERLSVNQGHAKARQTGLEAASYPWVAYMDSDDVSRRNRFALQMAYVAAHPEVAAFGGQINEFEADPAHPRCSRRVPTDNESICRTLRSRSPINMMTAMLNKARVAAVGGFREWYCNEDYYLWLRLAEAHLPMGNLPQVLVDARVGEEMYGRRGGWRYFRSEAKLQRYMLRQGDIGVGRYAWNVAKRLGGEVLAPQSVRKHLFSLLRDEPIVTDEPAMNTSSNVADTPFSLAMSVYGKDNPEYFDWALESVLVNQTVKPTEWVLVVDGPVPEAIDAVIEKYMSICSGGVIIRLLENKGLGEALRVAVENCSQALVARMDSDDICQPTRFEQQLHFLEAHPEVDIVGGQITEFIGEATHIVARREVPCLDQDIKQYMRRRCPFNHMTVMFRKEAVLRVGNYQPWHYDEDLYLWVRMALGGCLMGNLSSVLVNVRVGKDMYARRGGRLYYKSEKALARYMYENGMLTYPQYLYNVVARWTVQVAMPNSLRGWVFRTFFRK